jgi:hypothetical protein
MPNQTDRMKFSSIQGSSSPILKVGCQHIDHLVVSCGKWMLSLENGPVLATVTSEKGNGANIACQHICEDVRVAGL